MAPGDGLVGRDAELAVAAAALCELGDGCAAAVVIEGEPGIGKTRLTRIIGDEALAAGAQVFRGEAHPFERSRPFGVVASALGLTRRSTDPRRAAIGSLLAGAGRRCVDGATGRRPLPGRRGDHRARGVGERGGTRVAGGRGHPLGGQCQPDGHLVDGASAAVLSAAHRRDAPASPPVGRRGPAARRPGDRRCTHPVSRAADARRPVRPRPSRARRIARPQTHQSARHHREGTRSGPRRCCARSTTKVCCDATTRWTRPAPSSPRRSGIW